MGRRLSFVFLSLALIFTSTAAPAFAAGGQFSNIQGTVVDSQTHAPIADARVTAAAPTGTYTARTDSRGFFSMLGVSVDTYTVSIQADGYSPISIPGVVAFGDQTQNLGTITMQKALRTIARVTSRAAGAFQPRQTIDSYTVSGERITQATGKEMTTNENDLLLAVPGVTLTNAGVPTIRGGQAREIGYEYDGVPFTEPFLGNNGSNGLFNGVSDVQVVEGAGDATQGNVGAGVINVVPKRGTYPGFATIDFEGGGPNFSHQFAFEYGFATPNNRISDYITFNGQRFVPYTGYHTTPLAPYENYFAPMLQSQNQFTNNFVYRFGNHERQSLQVLYTNISQQQWTTAGPGGFFTGSFPGDNLFNPYNPGSNPSALTYYPYDPYSQAIWQLVSGLSPSEYANLIYLSPGVPATNQPVPSGGQLTSSLQTHFLKLEYDNSLSESTFMALRYFNWNQLDYTDNSFSSPYTTYGIGTSSWSAVGGPSAGFSLDFTHQFGSNLTMTWNTQYIRQQPVWDGIQPQLQFFGQDILSASTWGAGSPLSTDWLPGGYIFNHFCSGVAWTPPAPPPSCLPRIPGWGIGYNGTFFQNWGTGLRAQWSPTAKLNTDLGVRLEGQNQHWYNQLGLFGQGPPSGFNPYDVPSSFWTADVLHPKEWQPRAAVTYTFDPNDSLRLGYGRSAVFGNAQSTGTPFHLYGIEPYLNVPAKPGGMQCGWFTNPTVQTFPCTTYAQQLYWAGDVVEAPDAGNGKPAIYTNYDLSYQHQFRNGWGMKLTPFYKTGTNLPTFSLVMILPGGAGEIFAPSNQGFNRTTGAEFDLTTPIRPVGLSGFLAMTYQNVLSTTPPLSINETNVPLLTPATLTLGDVYRAGYVSPFALRLGATETLKDGFSITPDVTFNVGYPYSVGNLIAACVANCGTNNAVYANVPQVDFGPGVNPLTGIGAMNGTSLSTNYYDPSYPGSATNPNIDATRGTPATAANGGKLSHYNIFANLTLQYKRGPNTFGVQFLNFLGNAYVNSVPAPNPYYQPVATGVSGPQTNYNFCANPASNPFTGGFAGVRGCTPFVPFDTYAFSNGAYLLSNGNFTGTPILAPLQPMTFQLFFQHRF